MSWLNISGNLSSIATNVTSFTREVLTEAKNESYNDLSDTDENEHQEDDLTQHVLQAPNELVNKLTQLQDDVNLLNGELSSKSDEIYILQAENNKIREENQTNILNLKQQLLVKENEIDEYETKLYELQTDYETRLENLSLEKDKLECEILKQDKMDESFGWNENWGNDSTNEEELKKTKQENESLSNEVMMKEIILNSIEAKMCEISKSTVDVADFSSWIDEFVSSYDTGHISEIEKHNSELLSKIKELESTIDVVEININKHCNSGQSYNINEFQDWLKTMTESSAEENGCRKQLEQIEKEIREFDEEYENFKIENFHSWIEKVQSQIDDLEVELLNEQETRDKEDAQRALEREKLNELFTEKQNEINALSVELYTKTLAATTSSTESSGFDESGYFEKITALQEQLNETNTRCEGLQNELLSLKGQNSDLHEKLSTSNEEIETSEAQKDNFESECSELQSKCSDLAEQLAVTLEENTKLQEHLNQVTCKANTQNNTEEVQLQLREAMEYVDTKQSENIDDSNLENLCTDLKAIETILEAVVKGGNVDLERTWSCKSEHSVSLLHIVQGAMKSYMELKEENLSMNDGIRNCEDKCTELNVACQNSESESFALKQDVMMYEKKFVEFTNQVEVLKESCSTLTNEVVNFEEKYAFASSELNSYKEQLKLKEEELATAFITSTTALNLLHFVSSELDELQADVHNDIAPLLNNGELQSTDISCYVAYMEALKDSIQIIMEKNCSPTEDIEQMQNQGVYSYFQPPQLQQQHNPEHMHHSQKNFEDIQSTENVSELNSEFPSDNGFFTAHDASKTLENHNNTSELQDLQALHDATSIAHENEIQVLKSEISELEKTVEELKVKSSSSTGGNMKFGALKRKLQDLQDVNDTLTKEIEQLKQVCDQMNGGSPNDTQQQYDILRQQLIEKSSECQYYYEQSEQIKVKFLDVQHDMNVLQHECEQAKHILQEKQSHDVSYPAYEYQESTSMQHQDQLHNLSLMLTEKSEECEKLQRHAEYMNAKLIEYQNDTSDLELVREECKQLKAMLTGKEHQSRVDETINMLQMESKQLKHLLSEKVAKCQELQKILLERENDLSDMGLLREECKQLKQMLLQGRNVEPKSGLEESFHQLQTTLDDRDEELRHKNVMLIEMQNANSDMDLLREECKQLKVMLMNKGSDSLVSSPNIISPKSDNLEISLNSSTDEFQNSFMVQVQQLEEFLKEKEEELEKKEQELQQKDQVILQMQNATSDMELLDTECRALKDIILEKEKMFSELQNDLDSANDMMQHKNEELKGKTSRCLSLEEELHKANDNIQNKDAKYKLLTEELNESMAQEENIHILQTEYRKVEERLISSEVELKETQERLFSTETQCERLKIYEEQFEGMKEMLKEKDEQLNNLRLQSSEISILESETVSLLHQELNVLKGLVYERENQINELTVALESKTIELQNTYNESKETIEILKSKLNENHKHYETLNEEKESLEVLSSERHVRLEEALKKVDALMEELGKMKVLVQDYQQKEVEYETFSNSDYTVKLKEKSMEIGNLQILYEEEKQKNIENEQTVIEKSRMINDQKQLLDELQADVLKERKKNEEHESAKNELLVDFKDKENEIENLESRLKNAHEKQEELLNSFHTQSSENDAHCEKCEYFQQERTEIISHIQNIKTSLQSDSIVSNDVVDNLKMVNQSIQRIMVRVEAAESEVRRLESEEEKMKANLQQQREQEMSVEKVAAECEYKIQDLQSQLLELKEIEILYQNMSEENQSLQELIRRLEREGNEFGVEHAKYVSEIEKLKEQCDSIASERNSLQERVLILQEDQRKISNESEHAKTEAKKLQDQLFVLQSECQSRVAENTTNSVVVAECERLREECEKSSLSFLNKNKECDQLKLDVFHFEGQIHNLKLENEQLKRLDIDSVNTEMLKDDNIAKQEQIDMLTSSLEDLQAKLESGKKEKHFLEQLVQQKENLEVEKKELLFQKNQFTNRVQELEIQLKHKDVSYREIEAKASRELDRLRNHLMMIEENHTRDILESQQREEALQKKLDDSKQNLSKKSLILQDSSKQFQEHVVDLEEQLHVLAAQRDAQALELSKYKEKMETDVFAIYNLQSALEQLQKDKTEQYDYLVSVSQRKQDEVEQRLEVLTKEKEQAQATMAEASLAVQGISKINLELQQKENELKVSKERINELLVALKERDLQCNKMMEASDTKMDKSLIRNLLLKYFQATEDKRSDIMKVIGGLLGLSPEEVQKIGSGAAPSKVGGWISNVWGYATPKKPAATPRTPKTPAAKYDSNKSFSELFVNFLEHESESNGVAIDTASLTYSNDAASPAVQMFFPATPDILAFHNSEKDIISDQRIPAPGQEIPRVHTHHAQSALKTLLS